MLQAPAPAPAPLELPDMAERLAELCQAAAAVPAWCQYATPCGPAQRFGGTWPPQPYSRADLSERLAELQAKEGARLSLAALEDSLAYAQPGLGRAQRKVRPAGVAALGAAGAAGPARQWQQSKRVPARLPAQCTHCPCAAT